MNTRPLHILQICPRLPYPLYDGRALSIFNITKHLAQRGNKIHLVTFDTEKTAALGELREYCELVTVRHDLSNHWRGALRTLFSRTPYNMSKYRTPAMFHTLQEMFTKNRFDIVHVDHLHMALYGVFLKEKYRLPIVLREHNFEATIMERFALHQKNPFVRTYAKLQYRRLLQYEAELCARFDCCAMITPEDEQRLFKVAPTARTKVIPAGVDIVPLQPETPEQAHSVLFLASLDWQPNVDGFLWFYEQALPILLRENPAITITIVGKGAAPRLAQLSHSNVRFVGFVKELKPYLEAAAVCIVPLLTGSGMRLKILEMFAHGKCVVSTPIGCEGIAVEDERELLIAESAEGFAKKILRALQSSGLRVKLGKQARQLVEERYGWQQIAAAFEQLYFELITESLKDASAKNEVAGARIANGQASY